MELDKSLLTALEEAFTNADLSNVTAERAKGFEELPNGYFLLQVEAAEITKSKNSGNPQAAFTFKVVTDGIDIVVDENTGLEEYVALDKTKNRKVFKYYPLTKDGVPKFISDMLKFEDPKTPGKSLYTKEFFTDPRVLPAAVNSLVGYTIYMQKSAGTDKDGNATSYQNLITWKRATDLKLPQ